MIDKLIEDSINKSKKFMICLKVLPSSGETCYNSLFQVRKTNYGLIAICSNCCAEHQVKDINVRSD